MPIHDYCLAIFISLYLYIGFYHISNIFRRKLGKKSNYKYIYVNTIDCNESRILEDTLDT